MDGHDPSASASASASADDADLLGRLCVRPIRPDERTRWDALVDEYHYLGLRSLFRKTLFATTSLPPAQADPPRLLALNRGHWGIENRSH